MRFKFELDAKLVEEMVYAMRDMIELNYEAIKGGHLEEEDVQATLQTNERLMEAIKLVQQQCGMKWVEVEEGGEA
jgi:hypothetical protein